MSETNGVDYGPLVHLIGVWQGDKGVDVAPTPDGESNIAYHETIRYQAIGDVTNAGVQTLSVLHYRQIVQRKEDGEVFHDETGYWMWDAGNQQVIHSLTIPRAVCVLAGGDYSREGESITINVAASVDDPHWNILQSPFMNDNARTIEFRQSLRLSQGRLSFKETTVLDIYGKRFDHTDENELIKCPDDQN